MDVFADPQELTAYIWRIKRNYSVKLWEDSRAKPPFMEIVGFVPTMGALHEGHLSLVRESVKRHHFTAVSIFVNPLQFGPGEDFEKYPRTLDDDLKMLSEAGADAVFCPETAAFYPSGFTTKVHVYGSTQEFEGKSRPGHFDGVTTAVAKLFGVVCPDVAYFGEKDYQQLVTIKQMATDLNMPLRVEGLPTLREDDGLAMSSRNRLLSPEQRAAAPGLYAGLLRMKTEFEGGIDDSHRLVQMGMATMMEKMGLIAGFKIDYVEIVSPDTLEKRDMTAAKGDRILAAVKLGQVRLIDNLEI